MRATRWAALACAALAALAPAAADAACCYFSAKNADILQPAQKVFLSYDPKEKIENFTVQPKFEGNALDFGMVIPTPSQPKLHEMPKEYFKHLAYYTILKRREMPRSKILPVRRFAGGPGGAKGKAPAMKGGGAGGFSDDKPQPPPVRILETGV